MKRFIITNLLVCAVLPLLACAGIGTYNYYLFNLYDNNDFSNRMQRICNDNWKAYLGMGKNEWFYFDADEVRQKAMAKNDLLMASYAKQLGRYLKVASDASGDQWEYPSKETLAQRKATLESIRTFAATNLRSKLRSQFALLYMRSNMMLDRHAENVKFFEKIDSQYINSVYKDMMRNIYAGALYKTGQEAKAGEIFADQGDYNSLMTMYYKKRSCSAITAVYNENAKSRALPFLLQDFVNNAQEADDAVNQQSAMEGKLFIRKITAEEATQMIVLCQRAVSEQQTETPIMWMTAQAWLEFMFADKQQSLEDIRKACELEGSERMKDCARIIRIYIESSLVEQGADFDNWVGKEMEWLHEKAYNSDNDHYYSYYNNAYTRIVQQKLAERYTIEGIPERSVALYASGAFGDASHYLDTTTISNVERYMAYLKEEPQTEIDRFLKNTVQDDDDDATNITNDLIGTKYMRLCQWEEAITWLSKVPTSFYNKKGYAGYAANRKPNVEPWLKRQWLASALAYGENWDMPENPKLVFARDMLELEGQLNILTGEQRLQCCYDLAVRYSQANFTGDCWFLMRDGKSVTDNVRTNEVDLGAKALELLREASTTTNMELKEKALFALSYGELLKGWWYNTQWNSAKAKYDYLPNPSSNQWKAFAQLYEFEQTNTAGEAAYVSKCDDYKNFREAFLKQ